MMMIIMMAMAMMMILMMAMMNLIITFIAVLFYRYTFRFDLDQDNKQVCFTFSAAYDGGD